MHQIKKIFSRQLRKVQTNCEEKVWRLLRNRKFMNLKFRRQHVIEGFVVDFFCREKNLAIEIDGEIHKKRKKYDEIRQQIIESKGILMLRVANEEIKRDETIILKKIREFINNPHPMLRITLSQREKNQYRKVPLSLWERG
jgi:very-short-patch-repair endonuclease